MQQITKCHEFYVYVVVENVENLDFGCVCVCICFVGWCPSLRCGFAAPSVKEVWSCLCMTHMK